MIFSTGDLRYDDGDLFGDLEWNNWNQWGIIAYIIGLFWIISYILAENMFIISLLTIFWYFGRYNHGMISLKTAVYWANYYHMGSLALGSFLSALLWFIQLVLHYIYKKIKTSQKSDNYCAKCCFCFLSCFE